VSILPDDVTSAVGALPGARSATVAGNRLVSLPEGELAVVVEGLVDAVFVPLAEDGESRTPVLVHELVPGDLVIGGWWHAAELDLPAGEGRLRGVGQAKLLVASPEVGTPLDAPLAAPAAAWSERAAAFAQSSPLADLEREGARLARRQELDQELEREGQQALFSVFEAEPLARRPEGLPPLIAALADAAAAAGTSVDPRRLETAARDADSDGDVLELAARLRVPVRRVTLEGTWWRDGAFTLLAFREGRPLALVPSRRGLTAQEAVGSRTPLRAELAKTIDVNAYAVYPKLPDRPVTMRDLLRIGFLGRTTALLALLLITVVVAALGAFLPYATAHIVGVIVPSGEKEALWVMLVAFGTFTIAFLAAAVAQALAVLGLSSRAASGLTAAVWDRVLHLPASFFRGKAAGRLAQEVTAIDQMRALISSALVAALAGSALGLSAIVLLVAYSFPIALVVLLGFIVFVLAAAWLIRVEGGRLQAVVDERNRLNGFLLGFLSGVSKLRVAGAEERVHALWASGYALQQEAQRNASLQAVRLSVLQGLLPAASLLAVVLAVAAFEGGTTSLVDFTGAVAATGQLAAAMVSLIALATILVQIRPLYRSTREILAATPEVREHSVFPVGLSGKLEFDNVTFGYTEDAPVLEDVSLTVSPGSFVALVGPSGAGKSTVLRLILGFETPWEGQVLLDGKPLHRLDVEGVRRRMGTVIQGARIMSGSILTNILGALPFGQDAAWEAADLAGIGDDIRAMPMRMSTTIAEGGSGFSGGQLQRVLLARALVRKPKILLLDEATSALDNETQKVVSDNLRQLGVTRIVVAHRLSTVRGADEIVVLDRGRVVERGAFDELVAQQGMFSALARRQLV
jgi:NHLM bacteriocin system ABC transporter ATP-binding protein